MKKDWKATKNWVTIVLWNSSWTLQNSKPIRVSRILEYKNDFCMYKVTNLFAGTEQVMGNADDDEYDYLCDSKTNAEVPSMPQGLSERAEQFIEQWKCNLHKLSDFDLSEWASLEEDDKIAVLHSLER